MVAMPLKICQVTTSVLPFDLSKKLNVPIQWPSGVIRSVSFIETLTCFDVINSCWYTCTFNILGRCAKGLSWNHGKEETLFMSASSSYSVIYLDIFAGLVGLICRFFYVIVGFSSLAELKRENLSAIDESSGDRSDFDVTIDSRGRYWIWSTP